MNKDDIDYDIEQMLGVRDRNKLMTLCIDCMTFGQKAMVRQYVEDEEWIIITPENVTEEDYNMCDNCLGRLR